MKAPKILPWVAKRAGISEELALKLWRRAAGEAEHLVGTADGPEYWGLAIERFYSLVEDESRAVAADHLTPAPRLSWMCRHQTRISMLSLLAAQNTYQFWHQSWQNLYLPKKAA